MHSIALVNQKGGVGKSTTAVNLSAGLARLGKNVLLIDLDPQAHSTVALGLQPKKLPTTIYSLLAGSARPEHVMYPISDRLTLIPASIDLAGGEAELAAQPQAHFVLKHAMSKIDPARFDFAIVDSPPQLGFLNVNSLAWVREVFIPVVCEFYALHGLSLLVDTVERIRTRLNPDLRIGGVIPTMFNGRRGLTKEVLNDLEKHFPGRVTRRIRVNVRLAEAPSHGMSVFDYAPESNGAVDYLGLAREILERTGMEVPADLPAAPVAIQAPAPEASAGQAADQIAAQVAAAAEAAAAQARAEAAQAEGSAPVAEVQVEAPAPVVEAAPVQETPVAEAAQAEVPAPAAEVQVEAPAPIVERATPEESVVPMAATPVSELPEALPAPRDPLAFLKEEKGAAVESGSTASDYTSAPDSAYQGEPAPVEAAAVTVAVAPPVAEAVPAVDPVKVEVEVQAPAPEAVAQPAKSEFVSPLPPTPIQELRAATQPVPPPASIARPAAVPAPAMIAGRYAQGLKPLATGRPGQPAQEAPKPEKASLGQKLFGFFKKK
jgi:chromosome partitioning protein